MKFSQEHIDKYYHISSWCLAVIFLGGLLALPFLPKTISGKLVLPWFILSAIAFICYAVLKHWATNEEAEEFKKAVKEAVKEAQLEKIEPLTSSPKITDSCPLENLSNEQKAIIEKHMHDLPSHRSNKNAVNMKEVARHIRALTDLKFISLATSVNTGLLRKWIFEISGGKSVPKTSQFNEAIRNATQDNIDSAIETIKKLLK